MTRETTTWAASITKGVFATYVMQLVERGEFSLDAPIAAQLPKPLDAYEEYRESRVGAGRRSSVAVGHAAHAARAHLGARQSRRCSRPTRRCTCYFKPGTRYTYSGDGLNLIQLVHRTAERAASSIS